MNLLSRIYQSLIAQVREINKRYSKPSIQMTPFVRISLLFLRVYLFLLVGLLVYKFIISIKQ
jgi:hypothetical protein